MAIVSRVYDFICRTELFITKAFIAALTGLVFFSALARTLRHPVSWAIDIAIFLFVWCVFFSADIAMRKDKLVTVDIVTVYLPPKIQRVLKLVNYLIISLFLFFLIYYSIHLSYTSRFVRFQGITWFSYTWVVLSVPVGCTLLLITTILKMWECYKNGP
ncbi:MAG: TRAP transporter small permease subunit [Peptococcaceae bacterium]|nr:TRAP transporter small permease subunit [Peptococcaceae bacterium]